MSVAAQVSTSQNIPYLWLHTFDYTSYTRNQQLKEHVVKPPAVAQGKKKPYMKNYMKVSHIDQMPTEYEMSSNKRILCEKSDQRNHSK